MSENLKQHTKHLSNDERRRLKELSKRANMTEEEYLEYLPKAQIYKNAAERLGLKPESQPAA